MAAVRLIREKGYSATRVEDLCEAAGVTKGAFFHHFASKEEMACQAASFFGGFADCLFGSAPYQTIDDPLERLLGYIAFRRSMLQGEAWTYTCLLGTMVQEVHETSPAIRDCCEKEIWGHAQSLVPMIEQAMILHPPRRPIIPLQLALFTQAVLQGAFVLAKASQSPEPAIASMDELAAYIRSTFS